MSPAQGKVTRNAGESKDGTAKGRAPRARASSPLREAQKELARQRLLEAAIAAFEEKGYVDVTVDDIVQRAGTSRGTFYLYFQSKGETLRAILEQLRDQVRAAGLFDDFTNIEPTVDAFQHWFETYVDFYLEHRELWVAMHQALVIEHELDSIAQQSVDQYIDIWRTVGFLKNARPEDVRLAATMLYTLSDQFVYLWLTQGEQINRKKITRAAAQAFYVTITQ